MKKTSIVLSICGVLLVLCTIAATLTVQHLFPSEAKAAISPEQAKQIALTDAGANPDETTFTRNVLETENNRQIYHLDFYTGKASYTYRIDGNTGSISQSDVLPAKKEAASKTASSDKVPAEPDLLDSLPEESELSASGEAGKASGTEAAATPKETDSSPEKTGSSPDQSQNPPRENQEGKKQEDAMDYIGVEKAKSIALKDAGLSESQVQFIKTCLDYEDYGVVVYDIEFMEGRMEYEYEIDALSGSIVEKNVEYEEYEEYDD